MEELAQNPYFELGLYISLCAAFAAGMLLLASILGPKNRTRTKQLPFECGSVPVGSVRDQRFDVRFYLVAVVFMLLDVEVIFLYPWAVTLNETGWSGLLAMGLFFAVVLVGLTYEWKKGVLDWN